MQKLLTPNFASAQDNLDAAYAEHPDKVFAIYTTLRKDGTSGPYQIVEIKKINGAGWYWAGTKWERVVPKLMAATSAKAETSTPSPTVSATAAVVTVQLPFLKESNAYLDVMMAGAVRFIGKSTLIAYTVVADMVEITVSLSTAKKRGLV